MKQTLIFVPMAVLALWTLTVLGLVPIARVKAGRARRIVTSDFRYGESPNVPDDVRLPNRLFMNLLEVPTLYYFASVVSFITQQVDPTMLWLAWAFVALRLLHSAIYLSYNRVPHRAIVFGIGNFVVIAMWVRLLIALL
jgi:hypothetical protein